MTKPPTLYKVKRVCCVCGGEASSGLHKRIQSEPNVIAIIPYVYRRGAGSGKLKNASAVQVCEPCLVRALVSLQLQIGVTGKLWIAVRDSISNRYSAMIESEVKG